MTFIISRQAHYSRGELLLRSLLGWLYILIPHTFLLFFISLWSAVLDIIKFWMILFTGRIPESIYEYQKKVWRWNVRVGASLLNLIDGYPALGLEADNKNASIDFDNPTTINRGLMILRVLFAPIYVGLPHGICLYFRQIVVSIFSIIAWWIVLFTGQYPKKMFDFITKTIRWTFRINLYISYYTDEYPPFNGEE